MNVTFINKQRKVKLDLKLLKRVSNYVSDKFNRSKKCKLNIVFTGKREIRNLNRMYRDDDRETDVLSFSYSKDEDLFNFGVNIDEFREDGGSKTIGEIIICPEVAKENACTQKENWDLGLEIILLIIHGVLHIYDFDHEQEEERIEMESIQDSILHDVKEEFSISHSPL